MQSAETGTVHAQIVDMVTFAMSGGGSGSVTNPSGIQVYTPGTQQAITATPGAGYSFSSWSATTTSGSITFLNSSSSSTTATINGNGTVTATFIQTLYSVSFATSGGGSSTTSPTGTQSYTLNEAVPISASPASGYTFSNWSATSGITFDSATSASTTAHIGAAGTITATFTQTKYSVSFVMSGGGSSTISPTGTQSYTLNQAVPIVATPASGYTFSNWTATGSITFDSATSASTNAHIGGAGTITATFTQIIYQVSFATSGGGSSTTSPTGTQSYTLGQSVPIVATAANGYTFSTWSATGGTTFDSATSASTNAHIAGAGTITATFTQNTYTLTVTDSPIAGGSVTLNNPGPYHYGDVVQLTANPSTGYTFTSWSGALTGSTDPSSVTISGNTAVTATFTQITYQVSFAMSGGGSSTISPTGTQSYTLNQAVPIVATPASGYTFSNWTATGSITFDSATSASTNAHIGGAGTITATFTQINYQVSFATIGGGSTSSTTPAGNHTYTAGSLVSISATAGSGYSFSSWSIIGSINIANPTSSSTTATINGVGTITAVFTQNSYSLTINIVGGGSVSKNQTTYHYGDGVQLTANPNNGYVFSGWTGDLTGIANPSTVAITGNMVVTATFTQSPYSVSVTLLPSGSGSVTINHAAPYHYGDVVVLTESPNNGWSFVSWSGDGTGTGTTLSITITGNMAVTANFAQIIYSVTFTTSGSGTTNPSGTQNYTAGQVVQINAVANNGYTFSLWTATGGITFDDENSASTSATINGAGTITSTFQQNSASSPSQTPIHTTSPTESPTPTYDNPNLTTETVLATSADGHDSYIVVSGVSNGADISAATLTSDQNAAKTTISLTLTGQGNTNSYCNITIPKGAIPYGTKPTIYVNDQAANNQGYTQDGNNYYVWFTTVSENYQLSIVFVSQPATQIWLALAIVVSTVLLVIAIILPRIRNKI